MTDPTDLRELVTELMMGTLKTWVADDLMTASCLGNYIQVLGG